MLGKWRVTDSQMEDARLTDALIARDLSKAVGKHFDQIVDDDLIETEEKNMYYIYTVYAVDTEKCVVLAKDTIVAKSEKDATIKVGSQPEWRDLIKENKFELLFEIGPSFEKAT